MENRKRLVRVLAGILVSVLITLLLLEAALWFIDPLGIATFTFNLSQIQTIANAEGYTLAPGRVDLRGWSFTIDPDGNRVMPPSESRCRIRFIGDSVAFGFDVDDNQSFAWQLAEAYPQVQFINNAKIAYNMENIVLTVENHPDANGYFWYMSDNDDDLPWFRFESDYGIPRELPPRVSAFRYYISAFIELQPPRQTVREEFLEGFAVLWGRDEIAIVGQESPLAARVQERYPDFEVIPLWTRAMQMSWIDKHPNAAGHDYLTDQLRDEMEALIAARCPDAT